MSSTSGAIGIFGGSFNPPHIAHVLACQFALCAWPLERILVVPTYQHAFDKPLENFEHRYEMARLAFATLGHLVEVSRLEQQMGGVSYTIDTVRELRRRFPSARLHLILGSDIMHETPRWKDYDSLIREAPPLLIPRLEESAPAATSAQGFFLPALSSTWVRQRLYRGESIGHALPYRVLEYIRTHKLYQLPPSQGK